MELILAGRDKKPEKPGLLYINKPHLNAQVIYFRKTGIQTKIDLSSGTKLALSNCLVCNEGWRKSKPRIDAKSGSGVAESKAKQWSVKSSHVTFHWLTESLTFLFCGLFWGSFPGVKSILSGWHIYYSIHPWNTQSWLHPRAFALPGSVQVFLWLARSSFSLLPITPS